MQTVDPMPILGLPSGLLELRLTARERAALARAGAILTEIRERVERDDDDTLVDIALAAYTCADLAKEGRISL